MARATKDTNGHGKPRKSKAAKLREAKGHFTEAACDAREDDQRSGVHVTATDGPVFTEALTFDEVQRLQDQLVTMIADDELAEDEFQQVAKDYRAEAKLRRKAIRRTARDIRRGVREVAAQQTFPVVEAAVREVVQSYAGQQVTPEMKDAMKADLVDAIREAELADQVAGFAAQANADEDERPRADEVAPPLDPPVLDEVAPF